MESPVLNGEGDFGQDPDRAAFCAEQEEGDHTAANREPFSEAVVDVVEEDPDVLVVALLFLEAKGVGCEKVAGSLWVLEPVGAVPESVFGESFDGFDDGSADGDFPDSFDGDCY